MRNKNSNPKRITRIFKNGALLAIIITATSITLSTSYREYLDFSARAETFESDYIASQKVLIKTEVNKITDYIALKRSQIEQKVRARIQSRVYEAHAIATNIFEKYNTRLPQKTIKNLIIEALRPLRFFDGDGYYYIHSVEGISQLHALRPEIEGKNRIEIQDSQGLYIVKELRDLVRKSGEGFLSYTYRSFKNKNEEKAKIAYVKLFAPFDWYIGTGDYLDTIEKDIQDEMLDYIEHIRFGKNSYIFVVDYTGIVLMNASQKHLIGTNIWNLEDPNGVKVVQEERKAVENPQGDFIYYVWNKPSTSTPSPKVSFMKGIKDWQWMIGAGIYIDDAQLAIKEQKKVLQGVLIGQVILILLISLFISLLIVYMANRISKKFSSEIDLFLEFFKNLSVTADKINVSSLRYVELRKLAVSANRMLENQIEIEKDRAKAEDSLRSSESRLKEAQRITHFGSWEFNRVTNEMEWSDEVYRIFEIDPQETIPSYEKFIEYVHPDDRELVNDSYADSVKNKTAFDVEHRINLKSGKNKRVREHAVTYYDDKGSTLRSSGTIQDVTELRIKEEQLKRSQKMDALGKLIGGIAHDYNNMLGVILGYSELLLEKVAGKTDVVEYVNQVVTAGQRARALTSKLLTFSRYKPSELDVTYLNVELQKQQHLIEKTLTARIQLILDLATEAWPVELDSGDLNDAIINMVINASHAIKSNGQLTISTHNAHLDDDEAGVLELEAGDYVTLQITDTGSGMDSETVTRVFDPFFTTKGEMGTGLGLSQVYGFVQRSGGNINIESDLGIGTKITIYFPRHHTDVSTSEKAASQVSALSGSETILMVDDEPSLCSLASEILGSYGYRVFTAGNAEQALSILKAQAVDVMFSDVIMPNMNGYELAAEVAKKYPDIIVQLVSGFNDAKKLQVDENIANLNILQKPYTSIELLSRIRELVDNSEGVNRR